MSISIFFTISISCFNVFIYAFALLFCLRIIHCCTSLSIFFIGRIHNYHWYSSAFLSCLNCNTGFYFCQLFMKIFNRVHKPLDFSMFCMLYFQQERCSKLKMSILLIQNFTHLTEMLKLLIHFLTIIKCFRI